MKKFHLTLALASASLLVPTFIASAQYAGAVLSYDSGSGFANGFTNATAALGAPASGVSVTPFAPPFARTQIVSIGAGGEITLQLNSPITHDNSHPYGMDFSLYANSFFVSGGGTVSDLFSHANFTLLQVSADNSTWYTLNPSLAPSVGVLFPTDDGGNSQIPVNPSLTLADFNGLNLAGIRSLYQGSAGGTGYDLAWAQDANGNNAALSSIDYIRLEVGSGVVDLDAVSAAPEPHSWTVFLPGLALLGWRQRRIRKLPFRSPAPRNNGLKTHRITHLFLVCLAFISSTAVADTNVFTENFTTDPAAHGWQTSGDATLFHWDGTNHNLAVTWDSSRTNSYFYHPLSNSFTIADGFSLAFDLQLSNAVAGGDYGFELAVGFLHLADATNSDFIRGTGYQSPNLVEFDYFPPLGGFEASVDATVADANDTFEFFYDTIPLLTNGVTYRINLAHAPGSAAISASISVSDTNGVSQFVSYFPFSYASPGFDDFVLDAVSISSYNDLNADGNILAQGTIGNVVITTEPRPLGNLVAGFAGTAWQVAFTSRTNWSYTLERSADLHGWTAVSAPTAGTGGRLLIQDAAPPADLGFYRVQASAAN